MSVLTHPRETRSLPAAGARSRWWPGLMALGKRHGVLLACVATLLVHLLSLSRQLGPDEGGFAMVARHWNDGGAYLYGPEWVDRPPGLIGLFAVADRLGPYGVRLIATVVAVVLVAAIAAAARVIGGAPAARWAAWVAFAFASSTMLEAQRLNGELVAAMFVSLSVGAVLYAVRASTSRQQTVIAGLAAGVFSSLAVLMKQNFVDAFVFTVVLLAVGSLTRANRLTYRPGPVAATAAGFAVGAAAPLVVTVLWASRHGGLDALLYATFGFRSDASAVMASWSWAAPLERLDTLVVTGVLSGVLLLLVHLGISRRRSLRTLDPLAWAIAATAAVEALGVALGENFWTHYLIALIPMVALAAGLSAHRSVPGWRITRTLSVAAILVTAVVSPVTAMGAAGMHSDAYTTGRWVAAAARPGDSIVVPYTHANVIAASGLEPGYPYAWSLPTRTLDPHLRMLAHDLAGPSAPTWVIPWDDLHTWAFDPHGQIERMLAAHYRPVALVCGHPVWLHRGSYRPLLPTPPSSACEPGAP